MTIKDLNPEAKEFFPRSSPYENHQKPPPEPVSIPLSPYYSCYQKILPPPPRVFPGPSPWYIVDKLHYLPSVPWLAISNYDDDAYRQSQPPGVTKPPLVPFFNHCTDNQGATAGGRAGSGAKNLAAKVLSGENFGAKNNRKNRHRRRMAWVKSSRGKDLVGGGSTPSPLCPTLEDGVRTTVMIKNIPNQFRRHTLIDFLDKLCVEQNQNKSNSEESKKPPRFEYDFLYLPMDFRRNNNLGYAFVNFPSAVAAARVGEILHGYSWGVVKDANGRPVYSSKVVEITWAKSQGKEEMVRRFRNSQFVCRDREYLPVVFMPARDGANPAASLTVVGSCSLPQ